jgi:hypothetical protein
MNKEEPGGVGGGLVAAVIRQVQSEPNNPAEQLWRLIAVASNDKLFSSIFQYLTTFRRKNPRSDQAGRTDDAAIAWAMLMRLSAMTPRPPERFIPAVPL